VKEDLDKSQKEESEKALSGGPSNIDGPESESNSDYSEDRELTALIKLLDDPDDEVFMHVSERLFTYGDNIIPNLEASWETAQEEADTNQRARIEELIHRIQFDSICQDLKKWVTDEGEDLIEASLLFNRYAFPALDYQELREKIADIRRAIWIELTSFLSPIEKIKVINQVLFRHLGFSGSDNLIREAKGSYFSNLLESRKGNPIALCLFYLGLAQELQLPLYGVRLPHHPMLAWTEHYLHKDQNEKETDKSVVFYLSPFRRGSVVTAKEITYYLNRINQPDMPEYYRPVSNTELLIEIFQIQAGLYESQEETEKAGEMIILKKILSDEE
jgi:regulator of sirC expression with transglutaminase-like and TPR domain